MGDLLDGYPAVATYDEMFTPGGEAREQYRALHTALQTLSRPDFDERCSTRDRAFRDQGITFQLSGEERPFPLDLVPRILSGDEWATIERGVAQRVQALELFLADIYGPGNILDAGVVPRRLVVSSPAFERSATGIVPARGVRIHVAGIDLVRDRDGRFRVLEDNVRTPSGISYVVENRRAMTRVFPELFASHRVRRVADYPSRLLGALRATAPPEVDDPCVVVLTPGVYNAAYFEHSFLARQMGVELVEGGDLVCRDGVVSMRTTEGLQRVDVVYRRIDDEFLDPLHFRPDSVLGCPGIVNAARAGTVTIANGLGNGVADDKALYPYVPDMIRYYLAEEPVLANVETFHLADPDVCRWALGRLDSLVVKPVDGSGGYGLVIGPHADDDTLVALAARIRANPRGWIAQEPIALSTAPTYVDQAMRPRHLDLRPFAVNDGERVWVAPGGLTRVALPEGSLVVNSSQGGGSKDTWVLADRRPAAPGESLGEAAEVPAPEPPDAPPPTGGALDAPPAGPTAHGQQQQQQQQQSTRVLSRIAESLYWIGRYTERAEDTARLLDVHYHHLLEDRWADEEAACANLLRAMGVEPEDVGRLDAESVAEFLAFDTANPGSITRSLMLAWEDARGVRETISSEMWEVLNTTYLALPARTRLALGRTPHDFFRWIKERTAMLAGIADSTLSRDTGWSFLVLGRNLERVDMTARLLAVRYGETWGASGWTTTLRCCAAYEAYLRTYRHAVEPTSALEFLLLDRLFPRSVFHALTTIDGALADLDPRSGRAGLDDDARRIVGRERAQLGFLRVGEVAAGLSEHLESLQATMAAVHDAVADRYFLETRAIEWSA